MENVLFIWIGTQTSHDVSLSQSLIQRKILTIFNSMKAARGEKLQKKSLKQCWLVRFKEILRLHKSASEAASAAEEAAAGYPGDVAQKMNEGGYTKQQMFTVDVTAFYWKKLPSRTFIAKENKSMPGFTLQETG